MLPSRTAHYPVDVDLRGVELRSENSGSLTRGFTVPNLQNLFVRQFRTWPQLSVETPFRVGLPVVVCPPTSAPFHGRIDHVVAHSSKKQMFGADTSSNVAAMANAQAGWDFPVSQFPRVAMSEPTGFGFWPKLSVASCLMNTAVPDPAIVSLSDLLPESICDGGSMKLHAECPHFPCAMRPGVASLRPHSIVREYCCGDLL